MIILSHFIRQANNFFKHSTSSNFLLRKISTGMSEGAELQIPIPFGHLAAKEWGNPDGHPVLAIHGWLDNAGTFDTLLPRINKDLNLRIICIDLPGHGFSSHLPPGFLYSFMESMILVRRIMKYFSWEKMSVIGHSLGANLLTMFASLYPDLVERVILIDGFKPVSTPFEMIPDRTILGINGLLDFEEKIKTTKERVYTKEAALKRLLESSLGNLTEDSAKILLKRGTRPSENGEGYVFTRDYRLRMPSLVSYTPELHFAYLERLNCEMLIFDAEDHPGWEDKEITKKALDMYKRNCKYFEYHQRSGGHHLHLNEPHKISDVINDFFKQRMANIQ